MHPSVRAALVLLPLSLSACVAHGRRSSPDPVGEALRASGLSGPDTIYVFEGVVLGTPLPPYDPRDVAEVEVVEAGHCRRTDCVVVIVQTHSAARRRREERSRRGALQVRVWDEASARYVEAEYLAIEESGRRHDVGGGDGGWGHATELLPGRYVLVLDAFPCGGYVYMTDSTWAAANPAAHVEVHRRRTTRADLRIDLRRIVPDSLDAADLAACSEYRSP